MIATWVSIGPCCLTLACAAGAAMEAASAAAPMDEGCGACHEESEPAAPVPAPHRHSDCQCSDRLATAPDPDALTRPAPSVPHLLPALDLWTPLAQAEISARHHGRRFDRDVGPPVSSQASLLAQSCLLIV